MKTKKILTLLMSLITILTCFSIMPMSAFADEVEVEVLSYEEEYAGKTRLVFYPSTLNENTKKYPAIIWANGTGCKPSLYEDLHKAFVKEGFIVIASTESMAADGTDQSTNADYVIAEAKDEKSPLYNKLDTKRLVAMGHSQGGRSAVNAGSADSRFACVVSIAGSNYQDEAKKLSKPVLFFTGTSDSIVSSSKWVKPAYDVCKGPAVYASLKGAKHTTCCSKTAPYVYYSVKWINAWTNVDKTAISTFSSTGEYSQDTDWQDYACKNFGKISPVVTLSATKYTYDGKVKAPSVTVKNKNGGKIPASYYTVTYATGRKAVGKYKVSVTLKGNYSGSATKYFTIVPKSTTISKLTATKNGFKATWKKQATQTTGYQIQYSTSSSFSSAKTVTIGKNSTVSKSITKLKSKKKYYVRIRTYKTISGTKYYSSWSAKKYVTTK